MTVSTTSVAAGPYLGNGIADTFAFDWQIDKNSQVKAFKIASGDATELVLNTDYTIVGSNVVLTAPLPTGESLFLLANFEPTQETNFESQGGFFPDVHESAIDKITRLIQQLQYRNDRSLRTPLIEDPLSELPVVADRASKMLTFSSTGDVLMRDVDEYLSAAGDARYVNITGDAMVGNLSVLPATTGDHATQYNQLLSERDARTEADANLQAQLSGGAPLEASAFSIVSWHDQVIENSVTIPPNKNAWSIGPGITIAAGQTVTVGAGSTWTIVEGNVQP